MSRRQTRYEYDEDNLFDSIADVEEEFLDDEADDAPFYEDPDEIERIIEEEFAAARKRKAKRKAT